MTNINAKFLGAIGMDYGCFGVSVNNNLLQLYLLSVLIMIIENIPYYHIISITCLFCIIVDVNQIMQFILGHICRLTFEYNYHVCC